MADETMYATHGFLSIVREGAEHIKDSDIEIFTLSVGGNTAKAGYFVTQDDATDQSKIVDLAITTDENFVGQILAPVKPADAYDLDDVLTDGIEVYVLKPMGGRVKTAAFYEPVAGPVAVNRGLIAVIGTEGGKIRLWGYTNAASETDTLEEKVGTFAQYHVGHTTEDRIVIINY